MDLLRVFYIKEVRNWHSSLFNETSQATLCGDSLTFPQFPTFLKFFLTTVCPLCILPMESTSLIFIDKSQELDPLSRVVLCCPWVSSTLGPLHKYKLNWEGSSHTHKLWSNSCNPCLFTYPPASTQRCFCFRNLWLFTSLYAYNTASGSESGPIASVGRSHGGICSERFQWDFSKDGRIPV